MVKASYLEESFQRLLTLGAFLTPALFLTVKGASNTIIFLSGLICFALIVSNPRRFLANRNMTYWLMLIALVIPFISELLVQILRQSVVPRNLDGPSRSLLAGFVFVYLCGSSARITERVLTALYFGAIFGIFLTLLSITIFPEQYWESRAATYFVDPITLGCFCVALLGSVAFTRVKWFATHIEWSLLIVVFLSATYVAVQSQSRISWIALIACSILFIISVANNARARFISAAVVVLSIATVLAIPNNVYDRVENAIEDVSSYVTQKDSDTPVGYRITFALLDVHLISQNLILGLEDGTLPSFEKLKKTFPSLSEEAYQTKILSGSHSEIFAQLVRKGLILGGLALWGLFLYPLYLSVKYFKSNDANLSRLSDGALGFLVVIAISSTAIQVFNLKMTASLYGFYLSAYFAAFYLGQKRIDENKC